MSELRRPIAPLQGLRRGPETSPIASQDTSAHVSVDTMAVRQTVWNGTSRIDIWWANLDSADLPESFLNAAERERAKRLKISDARRQFIAARAALRTALAFYLECEPMAIELLIGPYGKPELAGGQVKFNLTHSRNRAMIAVTSRDDIGVDCEVMAGLDTIYAASQLVLSRTEYETAAQCFGDEQCLLLYRIWTRKEAVAKATGLGLGLPWREFCVIADRPAQAPDVVDVPGHGAFRVFDLEKPAGFAAALAVRLASV